MKLGYIDIGSNSIRMLLATLENGCIVKSYKDLRTTRLSKGVDVNGNLSKESMELSLNALKEFKELCDEYGIENKPIAIATSAIRDSGNSDEFVKLIQDIGMDVQVISGDLEAQLGFYGVLHGADIEDQTILVIDIGGGSTELVVGNKEQGIINKISLNVGAVRLTERHIHNDPPSKEELGNLYDDVKNNVEDFLKSLGDISIDRVIGIGGTITNLGSIDQSMEVYDRDKIHNHVVDLISISQILNDLILIKNAKRKEIKGLQASRSDVIIAGVAILETLLKEFKLSKIVVSEWDNLEGLLLHLN